MLTFEEIYLYNTDWEVTFCYTPYLPPTDVSPEEPEEYDIISAKSYYDGIGQWNLESKHLEKMPRTERDIIQALKQKRKEYEDSY